jgi:hypothetical protein
MPIVMTCCGLFQDDDNPGENILRLGFASSIGCATRLGSLASAYLGLAFAAKKPDKTSLLSWLSIQDSEISEVDPRISSEMEEILTLCSGTSFFSVDG